MNKLGLTLTIGLISIGFFNIYAEEDFKILEQVLENKKAVDAIATYCSINAQEKNAYDICLAWFEHYVLVTDELIDDGLQKIQQTKK